MPSSRCLMLCVLAVTLGALVLPADAGALGFQPVSPEEVKMTREPNAPGAPAIILFRQVDRDDNGRTSHEDNYFRIKILTEEGRQYANVEVPFLRESATVDGIRARTIRPDGSVLNFEGKVFEKTIVKGRGVKYLAKTFTLPDVQVGSIIEYSYTYSFAEDRLFESNWILSHELFTKAAKFSLKPYQGSDTRWSVQWRWHLLPDGSGTPKQEADGIIRLEVANVPAFPTEDYMPPENELKSRVDFVYNDHQPEEEVDRYWKSAGKRMNDRLEKFASRSKVLEQAITQIVSPNDTQEQKLRKIYARVQQLRNTSYELRKTEQEAKRAKEKYASNVEDVWKQGYGTGTQLTWLYLALVRAAGFEAYGAWVSDRANYFFNLNQQDSSKLDANLVIVKLDGKDIFCDPGAAFTPFGLLPWAETGVKGLRLDKNGGTWIDTPVPPSTVSQVERRAKLKLVPETGSLEGKLTVTFTGLQASRRRVGERNDDQTERKKFLEDEVKESVPAGVEVELTNQPDWSASEPPLVAEFNLKVPGWVSQAGRRVLLPVGLFSAQEKHLFDHATRVHPIYFNYPFQKVDQLTIELPAGWQVGTLPKPHVEDGHIITYTSQVENGKNELTITRKLNVDFILLDPKYYPALRSFFQAVRTQDEEQIVLQPGVSVANR